MRFGFLQSIQTLKARLLMVRVIMGEYLTIKPDGVPNQFPAIGLRTFTPLISISALWTI